MDFAASAATFKTNILVLNCVCKIGIIYECICSIHSINLPQTNAAALHFQTNFTRYKYACDVIPALTLITNATSEVNCMQQ